MKDDLNLQVMTMIRSTENTVKRSRQLFDHGSYSGNGRIMHAIYANPDLTQSQLAELLDIRPQSLTRALAELEEEGYIERSRDKADRRVMLLNITEKGIERHKKMHEARKQRAELVFGCLSEEEKEELIRLLNRVTDNFNTIEKEANRNDKTV